MIIRRKHTANYTTIGNVLFNDERLEADEVGILAYLLSMPNDWEVRRPALARRWRVGRDSIKRIIHSALRTGWMVARKTRLENGTFHVVYEVRDEPGPTLSDEEIKAALSLVSSDAALDESTENEGDEANSATGNEKPPPTENPSWTAGEPSLAGPSPVNPSRPSKILETTDSQRKDSPKRARDYVDLKVSWPAENILSGVSAQNTFLGLGDSEKEAAFNGVRPYLDDCRSQNRKICDLTTYLREKRWERFADKKGQSSQPAQFKVHSPNWQRWHAYKIANGIAVSFMEKYARENPNATWTEATEWPPAQSNLSKTG